MLYSLVTFLGSFLVVFAQGSLGSRWMTRSINDFRNHPFPDAPHHPFRQGFTPPFHHDPGFDSMNMVPTPPPRFYEFFDPISGRHHKVDSEFVFNEPVNYHQTFQRSFRLQDASPFPSSYEKNRPIKTFSSPRENSYAYDNRFFTDFASRRQKSFMDNVQFSGRLNGNGFRDDFVMYLMSDWADFKL